MMGRISHDRKDRCVNTEKQPQDNLRGLKILVISMGLVLAGGMLLVLTKVIGYFAGRAEAPDAAEATVASTVEATACADVTINLAGLGQVEQVQAQGAQLHITLARVPNEHLLVTADRCTGDVQQRVTIHSGLLP